MQFFATALAFAGAAFAQTSGFNVFLTPSSGEVVKAGESYTIQWQHNANWPGEVTLKLIGGETQNTQVPIGDIATVDGAAESYEWAVDPALGSANVYGLRAELVSDPSVFQWGFPFSIDGPVEGASSTDSGPTDVATTMPTNSTMSSTHLTTSTMSTMTASNTTMKTSKTTSMTNGTASSTPALSTVTSTSTTAASEPTSDPASPTSGGSAVKMGSMAAIAGVALAFFAL